MPTLAVVAITLGLDSARASAVIALRPLTTRRACCMVLAFGAFDGVASLAGLVAGGLIVGALEPRARVIGAMLLAIYGLWLAVEPFERTLGAQLWVPAVLSVDNFGAGVALAGSWPAFAVAALLGVTSAALATLGFWAGGLVRARVPEPAARVSGVLLLAIAVSQAMNVG